MRLNGTGGLALLSIGSILVCLALSIRPSEQARAAPGVRSAVERALVLLQDSARTWTRETGCFSCHHQGLGSIAVALAREKGFRVDESMAAEELAAIRRYERKRYEALLVCNGVGVFGRGYTLLALGAGRWPRDGVTDAVANFVAARQTEAGPWYSNEHRPPIEDSAVTATALAARALVLYGPEGRASEVEARVARARRWLARSEPRDNEERSMRLLGLAWTGARTPDLQQAAGDLMRRQRSDGGWAQIPTLASDAYATGQALVALNQAGAVPTSHPSYQRGVRFLLDAQHEDGSWFVRTRRRIKGQRQVESGFPHGVSQLISYAASAWATMALALCNAEARAETLIGGAPGREHGDDTACEVGLNALAHACAFGSANDVRRLLEGGARANSVGPKGVTPLMLAVHDPRKVSALLEHGADVTACSTWGFSPILLASAYSGAGDSLKLLLERAASWDCRAANGATPLFAASTLGDVDRMVTLLEAGADLDLDSLEAALQYAACCGNVRVVELLLELGVDIDAVGHHGRHPRTALMSAVISGYTELARFLIDNGADLEPCDDEGLTALAWAAKIDPGHGEIVELLVRSGADLESRSDNGRTPLQWALHFENHGHARILRNAGAAELGSAH